MYDMLYDQLFDRDDTVTVTLGPCTCGARTPSKAHSMTHELRNALPALNALPGQLTTPRPPPSPGTVGATPWQRPDADRPESIPLSL